MPTAIGKPGRTYSFTVTINDKNGNPQNLTLVDDYALLASIADKKIVAKWRKGTPSGYLPAEYTTDGINGEVDIVLPAEKTIGIDNVTILIEPIVWIDGEPYSAKDGISEELIKLKATAKDKV